MTVSATFANYLKSPALYTSATPIGAASWTNGTESELVSPLALKADAIVEAARQASFLGGPAVQDRVVVTGRRADLIGKAVRIESDRLGYQDTPAVFVLGATEQADGTTLLTVYRQLAAPAFFTKKIRYISPAPSGTQSGDSWANAAPLSSINTQIFAAGASDVSGEVWVRADAGSYDFISTLTINRGNARVRGVTVTGDPMPAVIVGRRMVDPDRSHMWNAKVDTAAGVYGTEGFRLNAGSNDLWFSDLDFRNMGRGCFRVRQAISNLTITDILATNVAAFFVNDAVTGESASITALTIGRCVVRGFSKFFAKIQWNSTNILIYDCLGDSEKQDGDNFASGLVFDDNASNAVISRTTMCNVIDSLHNYQNGDGFSGERGNRNLRFEDCLAHNCTDGGWDFKGDDIVLIRCVSRENHRNYRLWGMADLYNCEGYDQRADNAAPRPPKPFSKAQLSVFYGALVRAFNCKFEQSDATTGEPYRAEQGGIMVLDQATINATKVPSGTPLYAMEAASDGKPEAKIITMPAVVDTTPPVISVATDFSVDENIATGWIITANDAAQLRILPGKDAARFSNYGWKLNIARQDYEKLANKTLFVDIVLYDIFKNVSAVRTVTVAIGNVADDPITANDLFVAGTYTEAGVYRPPATRGAWLTIEPGFIWQNVEMTIPAQNPGDLIAAITDQSGKGLHALQPDETFQPRLRIVETIWSAYMDNCYWDIGKPGDINFAQVTAVVMIKRDPQEVVSTTNKIVLHTPRSLNPTTAFNASWWIAVQSGATFAIRLNGSTNAGTQNVGIGTKRALTIQTLNGYGRVNGGQPPQIDSIDVANNPYPVVGQGRLGADFNGRNGLFGDFYGCVITDRDEQFEEVFRLNRQLAAIAGTTLS